MTGNKLVFCRSSIPNPDLTDQLIQNIESLDLSDVQLDLNEEFDALLESGMGVRFGGLIENALVHAKQKLNLKSTKDDECLIIAKVMFKNIIFLFEKTSTLFCNDHVLKLCSLFINPSLITQETLEWNELLFVQFTAQDIELCEYFKLNEDLNQYIINDTIIYKTNTNNSSRSNIQNIFLFRYVSQLYNTLWEEESLAELTSLIQSKKDILYYIVVLLKKCTHKIAHIQLIVKDRQNKTMIDELFSQLIEMNPIEIYVKERIDNSKMPNPRFKLKTEASTTKRTKKGSSLSHVKKELISVTLTYLNYPGPTGFFQIKNGETDFNNRVLVDTLTQPKDSDTKLWYSYQTTLAQFGEHSVFLDQIDKKPFRIEQYNLGNVNGYIKERDEENTQKFVKQISSKLQDNKNDIIILGYGQSGAGKTSALIYFEKHRMKLYLLKEMEEDGFLKNKVKTFH